MWLLNRSGRQRKAAFRGDVENYVRRRTKVGLRGVEVKREEPPTKPSLPPKGNGISKRRGGQKWFLREKKAQV